MSGGSRLSTYGARNAPPVKRGERGGPREPPRPDELGIHTDDSARARLGSTDLAAVGTDWPVRQNHGLQLVQHALQASKAAT